MAQSRNYSKTVFSSELERDIAELTYLSKSDERNQENRAKQMIRKLNNTLTWMNQLSERALQLSLVAGKVASLVNMVSRYALEYIDILAVPKLRQEAALEKAQKLVDNLEGMDPWGLKAMEMCEETLKCFGESISNEEKYSYASKLKLKAGSKRKRNGAIEVRFVSN